MQKFEETKKRDQIIVNSRALAVHLLAILCNRINIDSLTLLSSSSIDSNPIDLIVQFICAQVNYKSSLNRFCFGLLTLEWGSVVETHNTTTLSKHLVKKS